MQGLEILAELHQLPSGSLGSCSPRSQRQLAHLESAGKGLSVLQAHPLAPLDNRLLEKAELLARFSETLPPEPNSVTPATHQGPW